MLAEFSGVSGFSVIRRKILACFAIEDLAFSPPLTEIFQVYVLER